MNAAITRTDTSRYGLAGLSDEALLAGTRRLVAATNHTLAALLAHLAEVEARGVHRARACASLYTYCIYELRMSEDAAFRRAKAARLCRQFPSLYDAVAAGELHLTGLLMLGPHLTEENHVEVLARAKHRTKREIAKLVRRLDPLPDVPARVEPLGPEPGIATPRAPGWSDFVASFDPVRELAPGARPRDWVDDAVTAREREDAGGEERAGSGDDRAAGGHRGAKGDDAVAAATITGQLEAPQRYKVQFTASQEYVDLLERARDLLSHTVPGRALEEVHLRALRALVEELEKKKYAATDRPRTADARTDSGVAGRRDDPRRRGTIPAAVRRAVRERDGARCTYVDDSGQRCRETALLELHHEQPFALGGPATAENLHLRCRAHNALAAEQDFGRAFMEGRKEAGPAGR